MAEHQTATGQPLPDQEALTQPELQSGNPTWLDRAFERTEEHHKDTIIDLYKDFPFPREYLVPFCREEMLGGLLRHKYDYRGNPKIISALRERKRQRKRALAALQF